MAISAPRTRRVRASRRPSIQNPRVATAMPPAPHAAPAHALERTVASMRLRIRSTLGSATTSTIRVGVFTPSRHSCNWAERGE